MQVDNRLIDDLARVAAGAVGALAGVRQELEARLNAGVRLGEDLHAGGQTARRERPCGRFPRQDPRGPGPKKWVPEVEIAPRGQDGGDGRRRLFQALAPPRFETPLHPRVRVKAVA